MKSFLPFAIAVLFAASSLAATIAPVADTFVSSQTPGGNFGGAGAMQVTSSSNAKGEIDSLLKFDLSLTVASFNSQFGAGMWGVSSVTLQLGTNVGTAGAPPGNSIFAPIAAGNFGVRWMQNDSWVEGSGMPNTPTTDGITFNTLPNYLSATNDTPIGTFLWPATGNGVTTYSLTLAPSFVNDIMAGGLVSTEVVAADANVSYLFNSRSFMATPANQPELIVSAQKVPEPGSMALGLMGLAVIGQRRRRN